MTKNIPVELPSEPIFARFQASNHPKYCVCTQFSPFTCIFQFHYLLIRRMPINKKTKLLKHPGKSKTNKVSIRSLVTNMADNIDQKMPGCNNYTESRMERRVGLDVNSLEK